jgi:hypothetical protein
MARIKEIKMDLSVLQAYHENHSFPLGEWDEEDRKNYAANYSLNASNCVSNPICMSMFGYDAPNQKVKTIAQTAEALIKQYAKKADKNENKPVDFMFGILEEAIKAYEEAFRADSFPNWLSGETPAPIDESFKSFFLTSSTDHIIFYRAKRDKSLSIEARQEKKDEEARNKYLIKYIGDFPPIIHTPSRFSSFYYYYANRSYGVAALGKQLFEFCICCKGDTEKKIVEEIARQDKWKALTHGDLLLINSDKEKSKVELLALKLGLGSLKGKSSINYRSIVFALYTLMRTNQIKHIRTKESIDFNELGRDFLATLYAQPWERELGKGLLEAVTHISVQKEEKNDLQEDAIMKAIEIFQIHDIIISNPAKFGSTLFNLSKKQGINRSAKKIFTREFYYFRDTEEQLNPNTEEETDALNALTDLAGCYPDILSIIDFLSHYATVIYRMITRSLQDAVTNSEEDRKRRERDWATLKKRRRAVMTAICRIKFDNPIPLLIQSKDENGEEELNLADTLDEYTDEDRYISAGDDKDSASQEIFIKGLVWAASQVVKEDYVMNFLSKMLDIKEIFAFFNMIKYIQGSKPLVKHICIGSFLKANSIENPQQLRDGLRDYFKMAGTYIVFLENRSEENNEITDAIKEEYWWPAYDGKNAECFKALFAKYNTLNPGQLDYYDFCTALTSIFMEIRQEIDELQCFRETAIAVDAQKHKELVEEGVIK